MEIALILEICHKGGIVTLDNHPQLVLYLVVDIAQQIRLIIFKLILLETHLILVICPLLNIKIIQLNRQLDVFLVGEHREMVMEKFNF